VAEAQGEKHSEMTRFNEAIDESLTEATTWYSEELNRTREQFLAILGHDLRNPLAAIILGAQRLTKSESSIDDKQLRIATRILNSAGRMERMVNDLLEPPEETRTGRLAEQEEKPEPTPERKRVDVRRHGAQPATRFQTAIASNFHRAS
jgi:signal transduction histidine kinase